MLEKSWPQNASEGNTMPGPGPFVMFGFLFQFLWRACQQTDAGRRRLYFFTEILLMRLTARAFTKRFSNASNPSQQVVAHRRLCLLRSQKIVFDNAFLRAVCQKSEGEEDLACKPSQLNFQRPVSVTSGNGCECNR